MRKNQKGFLIVLCLCILSISGMFGVYRYRNGQDSRTEQTTPKQTAQVKEETQEPKKEVANSEGTVAQADTEDKKEEEKDQAKIETEEDIYKIGETELARTQEAAPGETPVQAPADGGEEQTEEEEDTQETSADQVQTDLLSFSKDSTLVWPVEGDVILNYSMDKSIYFSTLNQYKYHPAIVISTPVGSEVQCSATGKVSEITVDEETGTTLHMELGDGYEAIYGQLKEVAVEEGDTVEEGELLGYVSEPTKYYTLEGSNLYFQLLKDKEPVNPMEYIE